MLPVAQTGDVFSGCESNLPRVLISISSGRLTPRNCLFSELHGVAPLDNILNSFALIDPMDQFRSMVY